MNSNSAYGTNGISVVSWKYVGNFVNNAIADLTVCFINKKWIILWYSSGYGL